MVSFAFFVVLFVCLYRFTSLLFPLCFCCSFWLSCPHACICHLRSVILLRILTSCPARVSKFLRSELCVPIDFQLAIRLFSYFVCVPRCACPINFNWQSVSFLTLLNSVCCFPRRVCPTSPLFAVCSSCFRFPSCCLFVFLLYPLLSCLVFFRSAAAFTLRCLFAFCSKSTS